jgi:hypothetical protein
MGSVTIAGCSNRSNQRVAPLCRYNQFTIVRVLKNGNTKTVFQAQPGQRNIPAAIKTIAGFENGKTRIECSLSGPVGPCPTHRGFEWDVNPLEINAQTTILKTPSQLKFNASCSTIDPLGSIGDFAAAFWPTNVTSHDYRVRANYCEGCSIGTIVRVYPDIKWEVEINQKFAPVDEEDVNELNRRRRSLGSSMPEIQNNTAGATEKLSLKYTLGTTQREASIGVRRVFDRLKQLIRYAEKAKDLLERISNRDIPLTRTIGEANSDYKLSIGWPEVKVNGTWGWEEKENNSDLDFKWNITADLKLIGIEAKLDLTPLLQLHPVGKGVYAFIQRVNRGGIARFKADLVLNGEIKLKLRHEGKKGQPILRNSSDEPITGTLEITLSLVLEASVKIEGGRGFLVYEVKAGVEGSATSGFELIASNLRSSNTGLVVTMALQFKGIKLKYKRYFESGVGSSRQGPPPGSRGGSSANEVSTTLVGGNAANEEEFDLVDPKELARGNWNVIGNG